MAKTERYSLITESGEEFIGRVTNRETPTTQEMNLGFSVGFEISYNGVGVDYRIDNFAGMVYGTDILLDKDMSREMEIMKRDKLNLLYCELSITRDRSPREVTRIEKEIIKLGGKVGQTRHYVIRPILVEGDGMQDINLFRGEKQR